MWRKIFVLIWLSGYCSAGPLAGYQKRNLPVRAREDIAPITASSANRREEAQEMAAAKEESKPEIPALMGTLTLPNNATSIRADITDSFSCENKIYGYYADVENDCQIFHVCLPVTYADGKENVFRWSFICPEDTIFNQESFTCMRREDMTIECEKSSQYYDLNHNFGSLEEDNHKNSNNNNMMIKEDQASSSEPNELEQTSNEPFVPASPQSTNVSQKPKPVKVQKPNRRKPAITYNNQQKDSTATIPPHKLSLPTSTRTNEEPAVEPNIAITSTAVELQEKPTSQRLNKRPTIATQMKKENIQPMKPETTFIRTELYSQNRKRPSYTNRKETATTTVRVEEIEAEATPAVTAQSELIKSEQGTMFAPSKDQEEVKRTETQLAQDTDAEASQAMVAIAQPELGLKANKAQENSKVTHEPIAESQAAATQVTKVVKPIEAIEEIPAIITETEEPMSAPEKTNEHPAESEVVTENENEVNSANKETIRIKSEPAIFEQSNSAEVLTHSGNVKVAKPEDAPENMPETGMVPEIHANGEQHQSLGGFKPVDPEVAAEAEQLISDFINTLRLNEQKTEQQLRHEKTENMQQADIIESEPQKASVKAESSASLAENNGQQITESVSVEEAQQSEETQPQIIEPNVSIEDQMDNEPEMFRNEAPNYNVYMHVNNLPEEMSQIPVKIIETPVEIQIQSSPQTAAKSTDTTTPEEALASSETAASEIISPNKNVSPLKDVPATGAQAVPLSPIAQVALESAEASISPSEVESARKETSETTLAAEATQMPEQTMASGEDAVPIKPFAEKPAHAMPLSIDDIVEMVKERLDQVPKGEQPAPMQLLLSTDGGEPNVKISEVEQEQHQQEQSDKGETNTTEKQEQSVDEQELVVPIYQRVSEAEAKPSVLQAQPMRVELIKQAAQAEDVPAASVSVAENKNRSAKLDARKRRFLFRADVK